MRCAGRGADLPRFCGQDRLKAHGELPQGTQKQHMPPYRPQCRVPKLASALLMPSWPPSWQMKTLQGQSFAVATKVETKGGVTTGVKGGVTVGPFNEWGKPTPETAAKVVTAECVSRPLWPITRLRKARNCLPPRNERAWLPP